MKMFWTYVILIKLGTLICLVFGIMPGLLAIDQSLWWLLMYLAWPFIIAAIATIDDKMKESDKMGKKIINLTKATEGCTCLLCCEREATVKVTINRVKYDDNVIGFHACDKCLSQMQEDIHKICE